MSTHIGCFAPCSCSEKLVCINSRFHKRVISRQHRNELWFQSENPQGLKDAEIHDVLKSMDLLDKYLKIKVKFILKDCISKLENWVSLFFSFCQHAWIMSLMCSLPQPCRHNFMLRRCSLGLIKGQGDSLSNFWEMRLWRPGKPNALGQLCRGLFKTFGAQYFNQKPEFVN